MDPDPGARKLTKKNDFQLWLLYQRTANVLWSIAYTEYIFHVKSKLFVTAMSDQDHDQDQHWFSCLDPDPHYD